MPYNYNLQLTAGERRHPQLTIVATALPAGKSLFATAGVSANPELLLAHARRCGGCPAVIEAVPAESIGLEWCNPDGSTNHPMTATRHLYFAVISPTES